MFRMFLGTSFLVLVLAISSGSCFRLVDNSIIATIRVFLETIHPSRPLYIPDEEEKKFMKLMFETQVGSTIVSNLQQKMEQYGVEGSGSSQYIEVRCVKAELFTCVKSYLGGISNFNQENDFVVTDKKTYLESYMDIDLHALISTTEITYETSFFHRDIDGVYVYKPPPQKVRILVTLKRQWFLWFFPSHCFVHFFVDYNRIEGNPETFFKRDSNFHPSGGQNTLDRHKALPAVMNAHLMSAIPVAVKIIFNDVLDGYHNNEYVCKS